MMESVPDPSRGLRLRQALTYYAAYPELENARGEKLLHLYQKLRAKRRHPHVFGGALTRAEQKEMLSLERIFSERLVERLFYGSLEARGRLKKGESIVREVIPQDFWSKVDLSVDEDTATSDGITVTGLLIFANSSSPQKTVPSGRPKIDQSVVDIWMRENTRAGSKRAQSLRDCTTATNCTHAQARAAWTLLPRGIKGTRGGRKA